MIEAAVALDRMLDNMITAILVERHVPLDEIRTWHWRELLRSHQDLGPLQWDRFMSAVQEAEIGTGRAIAAAFGKQPDPLPEWDAVKQDPWAKPPESATPKHNDFHQRFLQANRGNSWTEVHLPIDDKPTH